MKIIDHGNEVYEIEDFLTQSEIDGILLSKTGEFTEFNRGNIVTDLIPESLFFIPDISQRILSFFQNSHSHTEIKNLRRLEDNQGMDIHKDEGYPKSKKRIVFGIAIYLNDNFTGGELNYPDINLCLKPKKASMVIHNPSMNHEVLPVISGSRYSITTFIFGNEETKFLVQ